MLTGLRSAAKSLAKKKKAATVSASVSTAASSVPEVQKMIEVKAYELFLNRGMSHGRHLEDWLQAEQIILRDCAGELAMSA